MLHPEIKQIMPPSKSLGSIRDGNLIIKPTKIINIPSSSNSFAKLLELLGMFMILVGFIIKFPSLMDPKLLLGGIICFISGWSIEKYILK